MADNILGQTKTVGNDQATGQFASGKVVFDASIRGKTDRFVHLYRRQ